ncbi:MAG: hypothetical protein JWP61_1195 [Friedmanniella sp.]|nr:hypothetical protein [Friedmanniella sp.]
MTNRTALRSGLRRQVETASRPALVRLHALPRPLVPLLTVVLVAVGLLAPRPVGLAALALVFAFVAWIGFLSWPAVPLSGRLMRLLMLALIVAMAVVRR